MYDHRIEFVEISKSYSRAKSQLILNSPFYFSSTFPRGVERTTGSRAENIDIP